MSNVMDMRVHWTFAITRDWVALDPTVAAITVMPE